jgi:hypothetical protein
MDFGIYAGDTNKTIYIRLRDSTTGLAKTGLVYNSAGAVASYTLPLAARAAITLATQTVTGAHSDGGFVEVDATNCKGLYRFDLSDAAIASGDYTIISIEFDGIIEESILIPLHTRDVNVTQLGGVTQSATDLKDFADEGYDPATNKVQGVVLCDTTTTNTDMVGTDSAALASVCTEARLAELDAANLPSDVDDILTDTAVIGAAGAGLTAIPATVDWLDGGRLDLILDTIAQDTTTDIPALLPVALVGGRMDSNVSAIGGDATAATNLAASALGIVSGACEGTPSTTVIQTDLTEATDDHYIGRIVVFTSGVAAGQASDITDYTGSTGTITVTALTTAPAAADTFVIV